MRIEKTTAKVSRFEVNMAIFSLFYAKSAFVQLVENDRRRQIDP